jgi:hypothetical protein
VIIPNGILPPKPSTTPRDVLLDELGLPAGSRLIGLMGRLWAQKRVDDAIWAADLLKRVRDDTHLLILGDGPLREKLRRFRDKVEIRDRVHFLGPSRRCLADHSPFRRALVDERLRGAIECDHGGHVAWRSRRGDRYCRHARPGGSRRDGAVGFGDQGRRGTPPGHVRQAHAAASGRSYLAAQMGAAAKTRMETEFTVEKMVTAHAELYRELLQ